MNYPDSPSMKNLLPQQLGALLADCLQLVVPSGAASAAESFSAQGRNPF